MTEPAHPYDELLARAKSSKQEAEALERDLRDALNALSAPENAPITAEAHLRDLIARANDEAERCTALTELTSRAHQDAERHRRNAVLRARHLEARLAQHLEDTGR